GEAVSGAEYVWDHFGVWFFYSACPRTRDAERKNSVSEWGRATSVRAGGCAGSGVWKDQGACQGRHSYFSFVACSRLCRVPKPAGKGYGSGGRGEEGDLIQGLVPST